MSEFDKPAFIDRLRSREPDALQAVVHEYLPQCVRAARGAGLSREEAEDIAQTTFITFIEKIDRFEARSKVRTWLFGILYNNILVTRRGLARENEIDDIDDVVESRFDRNGSWTSPPRSAESALLGQELLGHLEECLDSTPGAQRMAFLFREVEGLGTEEICKILGISATNLGVILFRARNRLRECLESKGAV